MSERRARQAGYNLIEVLIAMGLLATVMLSIVTLFVMGRANVYSGKQMTRAVSVGTSVSEDLNSLSVIRTLSTFGIPAGATPTSNTVAGVTYPNSIIRSTADLSNDPEGLLARWNDLIPDARLSDARVTLVVLPRDLVTSSDLTSARVLQLKVVVEWNEARRQRNVVLDIAKLNRSV
ncbi:MAG TPA: prepilin-type N-terminal cleavage/methylation domain-containing protein [Thermoanaerobaculia bacterium]|nr:prepilin-type N-terminal cleavage/methylation domain-containing protein [Thermoanaerobaculia bacterium]